MIGRSLVKLLSVAILAIPPLTASPQNQLGEPQLVSSGQVVTPLAPAGAIFGRLNPGLTDFPDYTAGNAVKTAISPDGRTLLVLTSGYNHLNYAQGVREAADSNEYVFVFDLSQNRLQQKQVLQVANTFVGLSFSTDGNHFYISGGSTTKCTYSPGPRTSGPRTGSRWCLDTNRESAFDRSQWLPTLP